MRRPRRIIVVTLIIIGGLLVYRLVYRAPEKTPSHAPVPVRVAIVRRTNVPISLQALGTVQAYRTVTVEPMITGPLIAVSFHQGHVVHKGQLLATIDPRPYQAALEQALAKEAQDRAIYAAAQDTLKRYDLLIAHHYISAEIVAEQQATVAEDRALLAQDRAAIMTARTNLSYTRIRAPIGGRTGILNINAGNIVTPGLSGGIVTITTLQPVFVVFSLPQQDLLPIQKALASRKSQVTALTGLGHHPTVLGSGRLAVLDNVINPATGTLTLKARFPNPSLALWPGAFVNVRLTVRTDRHVLVVPSLAIRQGPTGTFVYVVRPAPGPVSTKAGNQKPRPVARVAVIPVHIGFSNQQITVIKSGLKTGNQVVVVGASKLRPHSRIRILPSPAKTATMRSPR